MSRDPSSPDPRPGVPGGPGAGSAALGPGELLREMGWLRRLALSLARDADRADELLQETALVALARPPRRGGPREVRGWLATVMRNLVRRGHRDRLTRAEEPLAEGAVPASTAGGGDPAEEVAEKLERLRLQRLLADALLALDEPYRAAVLLRFEEGLACEAIGRRLGVSGAAARQRVSRGVARLRARLDREVEGGRAAWSALFLACFDPARAGSGAVVPTSLLIRPLAAGGLAVGTKLAVGTLVVLATALGIVLWPDARPSRPVGVEPAAAAPAAADLTLAAPDLPRSAAPVAVHEAAVPPAAGEEPAPAPGAAGLLAGRVVDLDGAPVAGASVVVRLDPLRDLTLFFPGEEGPGPVVARELTDEEGRFAVRVEPGRPHDVHVTKEGFGPAAAMDRHAGEEVELVLGPGAVLAGRVLAAQGREPVAGVRVEGKRTGTSLLVLRGETDAAGRFEFADLVAGPLVLRMRAPAGSELSSPPWLDLTLEPGARMEREVLLEPGIRVRGRVTDVDTGAPIEGAVVGMGHFMDRPTTTDALGEYELPGFHRSGVYDLSVRAPGYGCAQSELPATAGRVATLDFALRRGWTVSGRLVDPRGVPLAGAHVVAVGCRMEGPATQQSDWPAMRADDEGRFALADLRADLGHTLFVVTAGHARSAFDFPPREPGAERVDLGTLVVGDGHLVEGCVVDEAGEPFTDVRSIELRGTNADRGLLGENQGCADSYVGSHEGRVDAAGRFAFVDVAEGAYELHVKAPGGADRAVEVRVGAGPVTEARVVFPRGLELAGRVVDPDGRPMPGTLVHVWHEDEASFLGMTDDDGDFRFTGLPPGRVQVQAHVVRPDQASLGLQPVELDDVRVGTTDLLVRFAPASPTRGLVLDAEGRPAYQAEVQARDAEGAILASAYTDPEGRFTLTLDPGRSVDLLALPVVEGQPFYLPREVAPERCTRLEGVVTGTEGHRLVLPRTD